MNKQNTLNITTELPQFNGLDLGTSIDTIKQLISDSQQSIATLVNDSSMDLEQLIRGLEAVDNKLALFWSPFEHLNAVKNSEALREVYSEGIALFSDYSTEYGQNESLYKALTEKLESYHGNNQPLIAAATHIIDSQKRSGVHLDAKSKQKYKALSLKLSKLSDTFSNHVLDANKAWSESVNDKSALAGLPESQLELLATLAKQRDKDNYLVTLDYPAVNAILTYADDRQLRERCHKAFVTRASEQAEDTRHDNTETILAILACRKEMAEMLDFAHYAEYSLDKKMAESATEVISFLEDLLEKSSQQAKAEFAVIENFAKGSLGFDEVKGWDLAYVTEKYKQQKLAFDSEELKPWFSLDAVLKGLFLLVTDLYNFHVVEVEKVDVWHEDVKFYQIEDDHGAVIAGFYLDMYARENKRGGAWMNSYSSRMADGENLQRPIAYLTCNAAPPSDNTPALLDHNEVVTLFHEFGHGLHHMLTQVDYLTVSGISGVEWDAVELPSQLMENWCWNHESLEVFARHYETGEKIPTHLFTKLLMTKNYNSAMGMLRQLEFSLIDMMLHTGETFNDYVAIQQQVKKVRARTSLIPVPEYNRSLHAFGHIFAGGYAAGYYSYKWAEVLSADAFSYFEETGFSNDTAKAFLKEILSRGGSRSTKENFIAFRGREPSIIALLKDSGIS